MATKKEEKKSAGSITLNVEEVAENAMYLHQEYGKGTLGKTNFSAIQILPSYTLVIEVNKKRYLVSNQDIIKAVVELVENKK